VRGDVGQSLLVPYADVLSIWKIALRGRFAQRLASPRLGASRKGRRRLVGSSGLVLNSTEVLRPCFGSAAREVQWQSSGYMTFWMIGC
jgi:hypothetical protein